MNKLEVEEAADYAGLSLSRFVSLVNHGLGPPFVQPSRKCKLFATCDLDAWVAGWKRSGDHE